uniref:Uncharacterized protein n=1 Tax=Lepeophtheirus salmonis TaxID=72036 RepID=A0A0K2UT20_LEPSM
MTDTACIPLYMHSKGAVEGVGVRALGVKKCRKRVENNSKEPCNRGDGLLLLMVPKGAILTSQGSFYQLTDSSQGCLFVKLRDLLHEP